MTSATPKPRAGEHTPETDAALNRIWSEPPDSGHYVPQRMIDLARSLEAERDALAAQNRELVEALTYCEISTRADGQWADQSVHTFLLSILAKHGR